MENLTGWQRSDQRYADLFLLPTSLARPDLLAMRDNQEFPSKWLFFQCLPG